QQDAVWARGQAHNKLRSQLREFYPAILDAFASHKHGLCSREARSILATAPTPTMAAKLTRRRLQSLLKQAGRVRGIQAEAERLHEVFKRHYLHQLPQVEAALGHQTSALLRQLNTACDNANQLEEAVTQAFEEHPDAPVIRSFPGLASLTGARVLAEIGDDRTRFANAGSLKAYAGSAPVTRASGKSCKVMSRKVKNQRLAAVGYVWAFVSLTKSPGARAHYDRRRAAGDRHVAAQRNLFNRFMGMLFHCLQNDHTYDEAVAFPQSPAGQIAAAA
ncbi:transposase, partial [Streptomyces sp. NPDC002778]